MNAFLEHVKSKVRSLSPSDRVHVVLSNEACDLDSAVCAFSHAYHLSQQAKDSDETATYVPVLNVPRSELPLRTEISYHIPGCGVPLQSLVCRDEIDLHPAATVVDDVLAVTLVDHNVPAAQDAWLADRVVEVIDHHRNGRRDDEDNDDTGRRRRGRVRVTIEPVGSCSTLVARRILERSPEILDRQLVRLLLGTILVDTVNMSEAAGKKTEVDEDVARRLGELCPDIDHQTLFDDIQRAKFDISGLTTSQMLKKDFKCASSSAANIGLSSITLPLEDVLERGDLESSLQEFCQDKNLSMNIIMTIDAEGTRQLAVYSLDTELKQTVEQRLTDSSIDLERMDSSVGANVSAFHQHNRKASRKVVMPLVEDILRTLDNGNDAKQQNEEPAENSVTEPLEGLSSSNTNNSSHAASDEIQPHVDRKTEALGSSGAGGLLRAAPFDKKSISVDESVTRTLEEEWDERQAIINAIQAKQEEADRLNSQLEGPSGGRQPSLDSEGTEGRVDGHTPEDQWQDDEYSRQRLQGNKEGASGRPREGATNGEGRTRRSSDEFYKRPVPKDERESGDGAEQPTLGPLVSDGVLLRERKLTRPTSLLNRLSVQSINSVVSEGSIDLDNVSDEDEAEAEKAHSAPKTADNSGMPPGARPKEKRKLRAELSLNLDETVTSQQTDDGTTPAILTPTSTEMSWEDDTPMKNVEPIEEYSAREEHEDRWRWRKVNLGGKDYTIDMKAINPYKKVLSHGGYYGEGLNAIIVFASCYLPEKSKKDYTYVMNNLFLYVISTLELLVAQEYVIVYFHGSANRAKVPSLGWMRKCYQMIDRKLRKSLKGLYLVHPTTWLKAIVQLTKPFISHKFSNKLKFVKSLADLKSMVPMEYIYVPEEVRRVDSGSASRGR